MGTLLLDPYDITIADRRVPSYRDALSAKLLRGRRLHAGSHIGNRHSHDRRTAWNDQCGDFDGQRRASAGGTILVSSIVTWTTSTSLTLDAAQNISIAAPIKATGAGSLTLTAGGDIVQTLAAPITASTLAATSATGKVVLTDGANLVSSVSGSAFQGFSFRNNGDISVGGITTTTGSIFLEAAGDGFGTITQTAPIGGPALFAVAVNDVRLNSALNSVTTLSGVSGGEFDFTNASPTLTIGPVSYFASGKILTPELLTSPAGVSGAGCDVNCPANVVISNAGNFAISAGSKIDNGPFVSLPPTGNIVLAATGSFINNAGSGVVSAPNGARQVFGFPDRRRL